MDGEQLSILTSLNKLSDSIESLYGRSSTKHENKFDHSQKG